MQGSLQPFLFPFIPLLLSNTFVNLGNCLDFATEACRVAERNTALEKASEGIDICGLIPDAIMLLCCFKIMLSILERQLMVVKDL
jgi:hypothetical protein